jgi:hypothetical protein
MSKYVIHAVVTAHRRNMQALRDLYRSLELRPVLPQSVVPVVVFMAFSVEAFINDLGFRNVPNWEELERKPWRNKLKILHKQHGKLLDESNRNLVFAAQLFELRDKLAHGKPEEVSGPRFSDEANAEEFIKNAEFEPTWFSALNEAWYEESKTKFEELMEYLAVLCGMSPTAHFHRATAYVVETRVGS